MISTTPKKVDRNISDMRRYMRFRKILGCTVLVVFLILAHQPVRALSTSDPVDSVDDAVTRLVQFCMEPKTALDEQAVATLVDYVLSLKSNKAFSLPKSRECTGAYYEFDTKISFPRFMDYSYSSVVPSVITRPSSMRYSLWSNSRGESQPLPAAWKPVPPSGTPVVVHGFQREADTPDLNTGVYHEYDLKRTLILVNHRGRQALISISKQIRKSNVGKKGVILGNDNDWTYYYSSEPGTPKTGIGWVKSYIYDYFSIGVYVESSAAVVKTGVFQWLRAGWSGMNFVRSNHILGGMKRFAHNSKAVLESPRLPSPSQIMSVYQRLSNVPVNELRKEYAALQQALRSSAMRTGKIGKVASDSQMSFANIPKEQIVEELMLEYVKMSLGKPTLAGQFLRGQTGSSSRSLY
ncbi:MAG: hypothetical protein A4E65_01283 [Syntrophorhabdus sp. PtaU1.Bin153]|nr:MAG: hypothetical protein A4E65_01283 [Syntrophorhabdus sp. PtaU1.Bin153]